jgi:predicted DNA-binding protein
MVSKKDRLRLVKIQTTVYLDPEQSEALKLLAKVTCRTQQSLLREGVTYILDKNKRLLVR